MSEWLNFSSNTYQLAIFVIAILAGVPLGAWGLKRLMDEYTKEFAPATDLTQLRGDHEQLRKDHEHGLTEIRTALTGLDVSQIEHHARMYELIRQQTAGVADVRERVVRIEASCELHRGKTA